MLELTPLYASVLAIIFFVLSIRVVIGRRRARIALGDGSDRTLLRRTRVQANFAEYVPMVLLLMAFAEFNGVSSLELHLIGATLLLGRVLHLIGFGREPDILPLRVVGMILTFAALLIAAAGNLRLALF